MGEVTRGLLGLGRKPAGGQALGAVPKRTGVWSIISAIVSALFSLFKSFTTVQASVASCLAILSGSIALSGVGMLTGLAMARYYTPPTADFSRPLFFDYTTPVAFATVPLMNAAPRSTLYRSPGVGSLIKDSTLGAHMQIDPRDRFLQKGQQVRVDVTLRLPQRHVDLFQITGQLLSYDGKVVAQGTRTHMPMAQPAILTFARQFVLAPLHLLGLYDDAITVKLPVLDAYEEKENDPSVIFRAYLTSRNATAGVLPPPPVYAASVHVRLKLGMLRGLLYRLRPGFYTSLVLGTIATGITLGAGLTTLFLVLLALSLHHVSKERSKAKAAPPAVDLAAQQRSLAASQGGYGGTSTGNMSVRSHGASSTRSGGRGGGRRAVPEESEYGYSDDDGASSSASYPRSAGGGRRHHESHGPRSDVDALQALHVGSDYLQLPPGEPSASPGGAFAGSERGATYAPSLDAPATPTPEPAPITSAAHVNADNAYNGVGGSHPTGLLSSRVAEWTHEQQQLRQEQLEAMQALMSGAAAVSQGAPPAVDATAGVPADGYIVLPSTVGPSQVAPVNAEQIVGVEGESSKLMVEQVLGEQQQMAHHAGSHSSDDAVGVVHVMGYEAPVIVQEEIAGRGVDEGLTPVFGSVSGDGLTQRVATAWAP